MATLELQQAVLQDVIGGDVEAFLTTLDKYAQPRSSALRYLMDWFHQWQTEYEAYVQVLETEEAKADVEDDEDDEVEQEAEPNDIEAIVDGKLETIAKDLEELEAEAQDVLGGVRVLAIELLERESEQDADATPKTPAKLVDKHGWTLLMQAANSGMRDLLQVLIEEHHADVNAGGETTNGLSPLYLAVASDHMEEALLLLQHGAVASATRVVEKRIEAENEEDGTNKTEEQLETEPPIETEEDCAWFEACRQGQVTVVTEMLARGVDVNYTLPSTGDSALHVSAMMDMQDVVELLVAQKDVLLNATNHSGQTCLFGCSDVELAQFLVDHGVDPKVVDADGETAFSVAEQLEDEEVCAFLGPLTKV